MSRKKRSTMLNQGAGVEVRRAAGRARFPSIATAPDAPAKAALERGQFPRTDPRPPRFATPQQPAARSAHAGPGVRSRASNVPVWPTPRAPIRTTRSSRQPASVSPSARDAEWRSEIQI